MKKEFSFKLCYELDIPFAVAVVTYLDCEHYLYLHKSLSKKAEILSASKNFFEHMEVMEVLGIKFGQIYKVRYLPPGTFHQFDFRPVGKFGLYSLIKLETILNYYPTEKGTTLSELIVNLTLPAWIYPFRNLIKKILKKVKIDKDLEDLEMIKRRAHLFGRGDISGYFKKGQFILFKDSFRENFGPQSEFYGVPNPKYFKQNWPDINESI